jgi:peptide deformylase
MILPIRTLGDPVLREPARPVERFDASLEALARDMFETMYAAPVSVSPARRSGSR